MRQAEPPVGDKGICCFMSERGNLKRHTLTLSKLSLLVRYTPPYLWLWLDGVLGEALATTQDTQTQLIEHSRSLGTIFGCHGAVSGLIIFRRPLFFPHACERHPIACCMLSLAFKSRCLGASDCSLIIISSNKFNKPLLMPGFPFWHSNAQRFAAWSDASHSLLLVLGIHSSAAVIETLALTTETGKAPSRRGQTEED